MNIISHKGTEAQRIDIQNNQVSRETAQFAELVQRGMSRAIEAEVAELRRLKLPVIRSVNGKPFDFNPDTNPDAPPWSEPGKVSTDENVAVGC